MYTHILFHLSKYQGNRGKGDIWGKKRDFWPLSYKMVYFHAPLSGWCRAKSGFPLCPFYWRDGHRNHIYPTFGDKGDFFGQSGFITCIYLYIYVFLILLLFFSPLFNFLLSYIRLYALYRFYTLCLSNTLLLSNFVLYNNISNINPYFVPFFPKYKIIVYLTPLSYRDFNRAGAGLSS